MLNDIKRELSSFKLLSILLTIAIGIYLLQFLWGFLAYFSDIFVILILSWLLGFVLEPVVDGISSLLHLGRTKSAVLAYAGLAVILTVAILLFIPLVVQQFEVLSVSIPFLLDSVPPFVANWVDQFLSSIVNYFSVIPSVANFLFSLVVILIISFYLIVDRDRINHEIYELVPERRQRALRAIERIINQTFARFIRVQLIFAIISGLGTWLILLLSGVDFAASIGLLSGILTIVPLVGPVFAIIPPIVVSYLFDPARTVFIFIALLIFQQIVFNIWGPKFLGKTFKMHPIVVFLAFILGMKIAGILGAIFAIPVVGILILMIRDLGHYLISPQEEEK